MTAEEEVISLRQENQALRERARVQQEQIEVQQTVIDQQQRLIEGLQQQTDLLKEQVQALQKRLKKDSHNSHLPPSSDRFHRQPKSLRKSSGKKPGGPSGHPGSCLMLSPTPDQVISHPVECCQHCQHDLREVQSLQVERRQVLDLPPKRIVVIEHQAQQKWCPGWKPISTVPFPEDLRAPVQYGAALGAVAVYLVEPQVLPSERACEVIGERHGTPDERGHAARTGRAVCRAVGTGGAADQSRAETRPRCCIRMKPACMWEANATGCMKVATERLTHYAVHPKRGKEALDAIGMLADFQGASVHDGWRLYWQYLCQHACCNVRHLRDLTFLEEEQQQEWASEMKELLLDSKAAVAQARAAGRSYLHPLEVQDWKVRYGALLAQGYQANPPDPPPETGKKGRRK